MAIDFNDLVNGNTTTVSGVTLLLGYLLFDSFTANWQNSLFKGIKSSFFPLFYLKIFRIYDEILRRKSNFIIEDEVIH